MCVATSDLALPRVRGEANDSGGVLHGFQLFVQPGYVS